MKNRRTILIALILFGIWTSIQAQNAIPTVGGNATNSNGSVSYTVGQLSYNTYEGTNGTVTQGIQQPYETMVIGIDEPKDIALICMVHPNPTSGFLKLKIENFKTSQDLRYRLYDMNNRLLQSIIIETSETIIPMENLMPATYLIIITENKKEVKTFKIIKN